MVFKITSHRGHHEATLEQEAGRMVFEKLTGLTRARLPEAARVYVPENFGELETLWRDGAGEYTAFAVSPDKELTPLRKFDPAVKEVLLLAPIAGG